MVDNGNFPPFSNSGVAFYQLDGRVTLLAGKKIKGSLRTMWDCASAHTCSSTKCHCRRKQQHMARWSPQHINVVPGTNSWNMPSPLTHPFPYSYSLYPTIKAPGTVYAWGNKALREVTCTVERNYVMTKRGAVDSRDVGSVLQQTVQPPVLHNFRHCRAHGNPTTFSCN